MASVYTNDLRLEEIGSGEQSGTWGDTTNTNLELIAEAFSFGTEAITTNADTHTTTIADGATDPGRSIFLKYTGALDSACTITLAPNSVSKLWFIENGTSGSQNIIISQGSGASVTIPAGQTKAVYSNGAGSTAAIVDAFATLDVVDLRVDDDLTVVDDATIGGTLGVTGVVTANAGVVVDNITIDGTEIDLSSGSLTIDAHTDIILDADSGNWRFKDDGTSVLEISRDSNTSVTLFSAVSDMDILFKGNDGGGTITALTLDMSQAGEADFNSAIKVSNQIVAHQTNKGVLEYNSNITRLRSYGASAGTGELRFQTGGGGGSADSLAMIIDNSQNVGIANSSPSSQTAGAQNLVVGTSGSTGITILSGSSASNGSIFFADGTSGNEGFRGFLQYTHEASGVSDYFTIGTAGSERVRIDSTGRVGIGVSPETTSNGKSLTINRTVINDDDSGSFHISQNAYFNSAWKYVENGTAEKITFASGVTTFDRAASNSSGADASLSWLESMRIDSSGNVGIGHAPSGNLTAGYVLRLDGGSQTFLAFNNDTHTTQVTGGFVIGHDASAARITQRENQPLIFDTNNSESMHIDSSGNVGIGVSPSNRLHALLDSSTTNDTVDVMRIEATSSGTPAVGFGPTIRFQGERAGAASDLMGRIGFVADNMTSSRIDGAFVVETGIDGTPTERMRIDSNGNVFINKTAENASVTGFQFKPSGEAIIGRAGDDTHLIFQNTSDGSTTGSIGTNSTRILIKSNGDASGLRFDAAGYTPFKNSAVANGTVDLGYDSGRFKDLYLSNRVKLSAGGGIEFGNSTGSRSASSTLFDDYEEGTFTAAIECTTSGSITLASGGDAAFYTKIGRMVFIGARLEVSSVSSPSGNLKITGLPFTASHATEIAGSNAGSGIIFVPSSDISGQLAVEMAGSESKILIRGGGGLASGVTSIANKIGASSLIAFSMAYVAT